MKDTFIISNHLNASVNLFNNDYFDTLEIIGLTSKKRSLFSVSTPTVPGDFVYGGHDDGRDMTIVVKPKNKNITSAESAIRYIFSILTDEEMFLQWRKNLMTAPGTVTTKIVSIPFFVEEVKFERFEEGVPGRIYIHCPDSYFSAASPVHYNLNSSNNFSNTFENSGEHSVGATIIINFSGEITDLTFTNSASGKTMHLKSIPDVSKITVNTAAGEKSIEDVNGNNLMSCFDVETEWLQIERGENTISLTSTLGSGASITSAVIWFYEVYV